MRDVLKYRNLKKYDKELHGNKGKSWTSQEIKLIMAKEYSDADLSVLLGRTSSSISNQRCKLKKEMMDNE